MLPQAGSQEYLQVLGGQEDGTRVLHHHPPANLPGHHETQGQETGVLRNASFPRGPGPHEN